VAQAEAAEVELLPLVSQVQRAEPAEIVVVVAEEAELVKPQAVAERVVLVERAEFT
jgi:hypothetical protein